ncbi:glycogen phosphorylase putative [Entamoeba histolytica]|uniref:Alpha-1,4 glucan phosphorylase n=1 Tax=Entamoeba histolytica TaxID=5759 RepID=A0A175JRF8_ENTHI|nr:glycogen phosphorylase putative [Entamoeba histolytica]
MIGFLTTLRTVNERNFLGELNSISMQKSSSSEGVSHVRRSISLNKLKNQFADAAEAEHFTNESDSEKYNNLWDYCSLYLSKDVETIKQQIANHIEYTLACQRFDFKTKSLFTATAISLRERMTEYWNDTHQYFREIQTKRMYYLSIEYLIGRSLMNAICNLGLENEYRDVVSQFGSSLEELYEYENDAALGSGGLGRLAACFLDSLATMNLPAWGYGIRYQYGMFKQQISHGYQIELTQLLIFNEQISTAGYEASGTSCMKFCMNGGLIIGTWDGANVEIAEEIGEENMFMFGAKKNEVELIRQQGTSYIDERLYDVLKAISGGMFGAADWFNKLIGQFWGGNDYYLVAHDFASYLEAQMKVDATWKKPQEWNHKCVMCVSKMGKFSSDRSMKEYAANVWNIHPCPLPETDMNDMMDIAKKQLLPEKK